MIKELVEAAKQIHNILVEAEETQEGFATLVWLIVLSYVPSLSRDKPS